MLKRTKKQVWGISLVLFTVFVMITSVSFASTDESEILPVEEPISSYADYDDITLADEEFTVPEDVSVDPESGSLLEEDLQDKDTDTTQNGEIVEGEEIDFLGLSTIDSASDSSIEPMAVKTINTTIAPGSRFLGETKVTKLAGSTVTWQLTLSPSQPLTIGVRRTSDGKEFVLYHTSGTYSNRSMRIPEGGTYQFFIRNTGSQTVHIQGSRDL
jgi:hypothetical protein